MSVSWHAEDALLDCRACGVEGVGVLEIRFSDVMGVEHGGVRCSECGSLDILDDPLESTPTDESVDAYVEAGAGIGAIADALILSGSTSVSRLLDVGCNYGFSLDVARRSFGWQGIGVEPSPSGARGARELGVDIRPEYLTPETRLGEPFDLVMAIEVIEHVPDAVGFLVTVRGALSPGGVLVMTTPAAETVSPEEHENDVLMVLSPGFHVFLASMSGMTALLTRAGFGAIDVMRDRATLRVRAAVESLPPRGEAQFDQNLLLDYYRKAARDARRGSALRLGLLTRGFRLAVARGDWATARSLARSMRGEFRLRYGWDLRRPDRLAETIRAGHSVPWVLAGAAFALGMLHLLDTGRPRRAADYFELTLAAVERWSAANAVLDLDTIDLGDQAAYHRAFALVRVEPSAVPALVAGWAVPTDVPHRVRADARISRLAVELIARGEHDAAQALSPDLGERAVRAAVSDDPAIARDGRDGLYAAGLLALRRGHSDRARELLELCIAQCADTSDPGAANLARLSSAALASSLDEIGRCPA